MKSKASKIAVLFIFISLLMLLLALWLVDFSKFDIPELIPGTELRTYGILILTFFIPVFIFLQRSLLKSDHQTSVLKLIIVSTIVAFISLLLYQSIRQLLILRGQYSYDLSSVVLSSAIPTIVLIILAAFISLELKKIKGVWRYVPLVVLIVLFYLSKDYLNKIEW